MVKVCCLVTLLFFSIYTVFTVRQTWRWCPESSCWGSTTLLVGIPTLGSVPTIVTCRKYEEEDLLTQWLSLGPVLVVPACGKQAGSDQATHVYSRTDPHQECFHLHHQALREQIITLNSKLSC